MSPQTGSRRYTHTHLKWFMGTLVFSALHCRDFSFFYFLLFLFVFFLRAQKTQKRKSANKLLFSTQMFFKRIFNFCSLISVVLLLLGCVFMLFVLLCFLCIWCFCCFGAFWCVQNLFEKKKKKV